MRYGVNLKMAAQSRLLHPVFLEHPLRLHHQLWKVLKQTSIHPYLDPTQAAGEGADQLGFQDLLRGHHPEAPRDGIPSRKMPLVDFGR
jgi:hypothetical protein